MLKTLTLNNVGPAAQMALEFAPRLNLITGDNGVGKSFLLDIAWWVMAEKWPAEVNPQLITGKKALPNQNSGNQIPGIKFSYALTNQPETSFSASFSFRHQEWRAGGITNNQSLLLYAMSDGSFAVWDPIRNGPTDPDWQDDSERAPYVFTPSEVWNGLQGNDGAVLCNGLIRDWANWQRENGQSFQQLCAVLKVLSPSPEELLTPGTLQRISLDDARDIPTICMANGDEVPVVHASSGMRRILALAYLLVWSWQEHQNAARITRREVCQSMVYLIDEVEAHLHPKWQRRIVPALMKVMQELSSTVTVQAVMVTHSPLVMASVEPLFDATQDAWFDLDFQTAENGKPVVVLEKRDFVRCGDASSWLMSPAFDLPSSRSLPAEQALAEAAQAMSTDQFTQADALRLRDRLRAVLSDTDPFWMRFNFVAQQKGWWQ